jgi:hypothetical protein
LIDHFAVRYLDDIPIYTTDEEEQKEQVRKALARLRECGLYAKVEKCHFGVTEVGFLGFVINPDGIGMESDRISTIEDWPTTESVRNVQVLLGFTNFYQRFIRQYAQATTRMPEQLKSEWTRDAELAFRKFKRPFTEAPILNHCDPESRLFCRLM